MFVYTSTISSKLYNLSFYYAGQLESFLNDKVE